MEKTTKITKQDFLKRCENAYNMGLANQATFAIIDRWLDAIMRLEGGQFNYWVDFLEAEKFRTQNFASHKTLANDREAYGAIQFASILIHPCQKCAEDPAAWHTRIAFCKHHEKGKV